jgi:hypothetical protein
MSAALSLVSRSASTYLEARPLDYAGLTQTCEAMMRLHLDGSSPDDALFPNLREDLALGIYFAWYALKFRFRESATEEGQADTRRLRALSGLEPPDGAVGDKPSIARPARPCLG